MTRYGLSTLLRAAAPAFALAVSGVGLSSCASTPKGFAPLAVAEAPRFNALAFFEGRSEGRGELSKVFSDPVPMRVSSEGVIGADGALTLTQRIEEGDKEPRTRTWVIREEPEGSFRYTGTLTDAEGPVEGSSEGNRLTLSYPIEGGFRVRQTLTLSADGQSAYNKLKVTMMGVTVAVLAEDIRRMEIKGAPL